jgi:hypothetical protein
MAESVRSVNDDSVISSAPVREIVALNQKRYNPTVTPEISSGELVGLINFR